MSTTASVAPTTASSAPSGSGRPATPVNPQSQAGPKVPATSVGPTTKAPVKAPIEAPKGPDLSKVPAAPISNDAKIKSALHALYHKDGDGSIPSDTKPTEKPAETPAAEVKPAETKPAEVAPVAEVKPTEAVQSADPFAGIAAPENLSEKGMQGWNALKTKAKTEIDAARAELATTKAQLDVLRKATPAEVADVAAKDKALKDVLDRLAVLDLQSHPDFTRQYTEPQTKAISEATQLLSDAGKTDVDFGKLLALPRAEFAKQVSELAATMPAFDQSVFVSNMRDARRLGEEAKTALATSKELRSGIEQKTALQQKQAFEETWGQLGGADNFLKAVEIPDKATAEEKAELTAYNESVAQVRSKAETNAFGRLDPRGAAQIASKAAVLDFIVSTAIPRMKKEFARVAREHGEMLAELQGIRGAKNPGSFTAPTLTDAPKMLSAKEELALAFKR